MPYLFYYITILINLHNPIPLYRSKTASPTNKTTAPNLWLVLYIRLSPRTGKIIARNAPPTAPPIWPARLIPGIRTLPIILTTKSVR